MPLRATTSAQASSVFVGFSRTRCSAPSPTGACGLDHGFGGGGWTGRASAGRNSRMSLYWSGGIGAVPGRFRSERTSGLTPLPAESS